jgi:signal transduction histidine kinase/CheY-like chemotaxis protein
MPALAPHNDNKRVEALHGYPIDYLLDEEQFNDIARLAAATCDTTMALIVFVDDKINYFKSEIGFGSRAAERCHSFCQYTILGKDLYEVEDAIQHENFRDNPYVTGEPHLRYYAGVPLIDKDGYALGSLCVLDEKPNKLTVIQRTSMLTLSQMVVSLLELKKSRYEARQAQQKAEEALLAKSDFISAMSHEIRTPLNGIAGIAHLLMNENLTRKQRTYVTALQSSSNNLTMLVNDILDYSKIRRGEVTFRNLSYNLRDLLLEIKNKSLDAAENKKIGLHFQVGDNVPTVVVGDRDRLSQVLVNLVNNAVKFTAQGHVMVDVQRIFCTTQEATIRFSVKDTGIGIKKEDQPKLFEWFTQIDHSATRKFGGSGLGLAICKRLLELQNSSIDVTSEPGIGTEFSFALRLSLPHHQFSVMNGANEKRETVSHLHGLQILLVEDNDLNILIASSLLKRWGISVTIAKNGLEAIDSVKQQTFDAVLMDIQMPEMNGLVAAEHIRGLGFSRETLPIIALSASPLVNEQEIAEKGIMNDFISKPFDPGILYDKLKELQMTGS